MRLSLYLAANGAFISCCSGNGWWNRRLSRDNDSCVTSRHHSKMSECVCVCSLPPRRLRFVDKNVFFSSFVYWSRVFNCCCRRKTVVHSRQKKKTKKNERSNRLNTHVSLSKYQNYFTAGKNSSRSEDI